MPPEFEKTEAIAGGACLFGSILQAAKHANWFDAADLLGDLNKQIMSFKRKLSLFYQLQKREDPDKEAQYQALVAAGFDPIPVLKHNYKKGSKNKDGMGGNHEIAIAQDYFRSVHKNPELNICVFHSKDGFSNQFGKPNHKYYFGPKRGDSIHIYYDFDAAHYQWLQPQALKTETKVTIKGYKTKSKKNSLNDKEGKITKVGNLISEQYEVSFTPPLPKFKNPVTVLYDKVYSAELLEELEKYSS